MKRERDGSLAVGLCDFHYSVTKEDLGAPKPPTSILRARRTLFVSPEIQFSTEETDMPKYFGESISFDSIDLFTWGLIAFYVLNDGKPFQVLDDEIAQFALLAPKFDVHCMRPYSGLWFHNHE